MIPVALQPEPATFEQEVRRPGRQFLRRVRNPTDSQFKGQEHWRKALPALRIAYREICAYCACWLPFDQGTLDHFEPKSYAPMLAYEWSNFRLAQEKINAAKGNSRGILDPCHIDAGWFVLDLSSVFVRPGSGLASAVEEAVTTTIKILGLNSNALVRTRYSVLKLYSEGTVPMEFLEDKYPFIAIELQREGMAEAIKGTVR